MIKPGDPRDGLHLRLDFERALGVKDIGPKLGVGLSYAATKAVNSPMFQRLQQQVEDNDPTRRVLEARIREINITNVARDSGMNRADLAEIMRNLPTSQAQTILAPEVRPDLADLADGGPTDMDLDSSAEESAPTRGHPRAGSRNRSSGGGDESGPPPPPAAAAAANEAYRQNIQLQAEVEGLREEMMKQRRHMQIAQEVQNRMEAQNRDPRREIVREFQQDPTNIDTSSAAAPRPLSAHDHLRTRDGEQQP